MRWDVSPKEAVFEQMRLRERVSLEDGFGDINRVAGVDVSVGRGSKEGRCGVVTLSFPDLEVLETRVHNALITFPYVPGLLAFREMPILLETWPMLQMTPDIVFVDGHGYAHPRRCGFACCVGLALDVPAIGCAKSRLIGSYDEPGLEAGSVSPLVAEDGDRIGDVARTRAGVKPVFVSPGHRVSFESAARLALACTRGHRIPEPTRLAHLLVTRGTLE